MNESDSPFQPYERIGTTGGVPSSVGPGGRRSRRLVLPGKGPIGLGLLGLLLLVYLLRGGDDGEKSEGESQVQAAESSVVLDTPAPRSGTTPAPGPQDAGPALDTPSTPVAKAPQPTLHAGLSSKIEASIGKWMVKARENSKGKVTSKNTVVAVHVRRANGDVLVDRNTSQALRPASNLKLFTCMAAVILCGDTGQFETGFDRLGPVEAGVLKGDLVARAGADPMYEYEGDGSIEPWARSLAEQLKKAGIQRIDGALVLDEGTYLEPAPAPEWPEAGEHWKEYCALAGGFSANAGCLTAHIQPGAAVGKPGVAKVQPSGHGLHRTGSVKTTSSKSDVVIAVEARNTNLIVRGTIPKGSPGYNPRFSHPDPVELFGSAMVEALGAQGIPVRDGWKRRRSAPQGERVAVLKSPVISTLLPILRDSNNSVADQLYLHLGHKVTGRGDRDSGAQAVRAALAVLTVDDGDLRMVDGSGLSKANRVRADQVSGLIAGLLSRGGPATQAFFDALPVAGQSGTLSRRMRGGPAAGRVHAKTGFVNGSSALSGVVETADGERLVFSILVSFPHYPSMNSGVFKPMQDEICATLAEFEAGTQ
ncbi:MAG: D-alanyl-D-alanine carboxypeptidase/D-alanyl-D-alanine-endopeptidase [Planctomycetes bacterium]|nr:D-alanyl-D-alanine carboxypeptidase/D-alanyl-D-alanine-endopeptidase [Planctomycetota bacterium]